MCPEGFEVAIGLGRLLTGGLVGNKRIYNPCKMYIYIYIHMFIHIYIYTHIFIPLLNPSKFRALRGFRELRGSRLCGFSPMV